MAKLWGITTNDSSVYAAGADIALHDLVGKLLGGAAVQAAGWEDARAGAATWNVAGEPGRVLDGGAGTCGGGAGVPARGEGEEGTPWDLEALTAIQEAIGQNVPAAPDDNGAFLAADSIKRFRADARQGRGVSNAGAAAPNDGLPGLRRVGEALGERVMYQRGNVEPVWRRAAAAPLRGRSERPVYGRAKEGFADGAGVRAGGVGA